MAHACDYPSRHTYWPRRVEEGKRKDTTIDVLVLGFLKRAHYSRAWSEASMKTACLEQYKDFGLIAEQYDAIKRKHDALHAGGLETPRKGHA